MGKKLPAWIEEEEFKKLLKYTKSKHHKLAFLLGFESGLRIREITMLKPEQVSFKNKRIDIKAMPVGGAKMGKERVVPLPKHFKEEYQKMLPLKCGIRSLQYAFLSAAEKSGLRKEKPTIHFHSLRHGFATRLINQKVPLNQVQMLLGHSDIATTSIYLHAKPDEALNSYEKLF